MHLAHQLEAVAAGHAHVRDDERMRAFAKFGQRFGAIDGNIDQPSAALEACLESGAHARIVVGDEQPLHSWAPDAAAGSAAHSARCSGAGSGECPGECPPPAAPAFPFRGRRTPNLAPYPARLSTPTD